MNSEKSDENLNEVLEQKYYILLKNNKEYKIEVKKTINNIFIIYSDYSIKLNSNEISKLITINLNSIDEAYVFILNIFNENKGIIKGIIEGERIKLTLYFKNEENKKEIEIDLIHHNQNKDFIFTHLLNKYNNLEKEIIFLKKEFINLKNKIMSSISHKSKNELNAENKEIEIKEASDEEKKSDDINNDDEKEIKKDNGNKFNNYNEMNLNKKINNNENKKHIQLNLLEEITSNAFCSNIEDNTFCIFNSLQDKILYLIYSTKSKSIICYNIVEKTIFKEIENPHEGEYITNYRHCIYNYKDIIMSISLSNNIIKIWEFPNFSCILTLQRVNLKGNLYSACFLNNDEINSNETYNYIITSSAGSNDPIKIFDFNGDVIKKFEQKISEDVYFIDSYFDIKLKKYYIITGNYNYINSYDFYETKIYKKYFDSSDKIYGSHCSCAINVNKKDINDIIKLIDVCYGSEIIYIWNFHTGEIINKIYSNGVGLVSCCIWDESFFYVGCRDRTIKLLDTSRNEVIESLEGHKNWLSSVKKINHPEYGECLVSQGDLNDQIKLWINKNLVKS